MEKVLGQQEIDALLAGLNRAPGGEEVAAADSGPVVFDFGRAGHISGEQMRAIATLNDTFARSLMHTASAWLRTDFNVTLVAGEQMLYAEYLERLAEDAYACSMRLEPLSASGLIEFELSLITPMVELLLGGAGTAQPPRRLTDIEESIMTSVVQMVAQELNAAWRAAGLSFAFERREATTQVARMMPGTERTLCVSFEIRMTHAQGAMTLCLPATVLNTLLRRLSAVRGRPRRRDVQTAARVHELVGESTLQVELKLPPVKLNTRTLGALRPGSLLRLDVPAHAPAELRAGSVMLGAARAVRSGEHRGACLEPESPRTLAAPTAEAAA